jgi:hypothetical protein
MVATTAIHSRRNTAWTSPLEAPYVHCYSTAVYIRLRKRANECLTSSENHKGREQMRNYESAKRHLWLKRTALVLAHSVDYIITKHRRRKRMPAGRPQDICHFKIWTWSARNTANLGGHVINLSISLTHYDADWAKWFRMSSCDWASR